MGNANDLFGEYNLTLVILAFIVASGASYCALELVAHVSGSGSAARRAWLLAGACIFGVGVWAMHFIGMLAFSLPMPIGYHLPTVIASMLPAIGAAALALNLTTGQRLTPPRLVLGAILMGAGIGAMHYSGMFAMRMDARTYYDLRFFLLSVVYAVVASLFALYSAFSLRDEYSDGAERVLAAGIMGAAITGLHFTAMIWASHFAPQGDIASATVPGGAFVVTIPPAGALILAIVVLGAIGVVLGRVRRASVLAAKTATA